MTGNNFIECGEEAREALRCKKPLVAIESGFLYHRDAFGDNVKNALDCLEIIRKNGAVPAVTAIQKGKLIVGMGEEDLVDFLKLDGVVKCNTRDIAVAIAQGTMGSTTVSSAIFAAHRVGIPVVTAGGIGGVHRNASVTFDISADLMQLADTPVAVVSSGAKIILDIPLTLEYLETHGVSVVGYGTNDFPAYYARKSGYPIEFAIDHPSQAAEVLRAKRALNDKGALLVANPIAAEFELDPAELDGILRSALEDAEKLHIRGKGLTAHLLNHISAGTKSRASAASRSILLNNAALAAKISAELGFVGGPGGAAPW
jgi:pseudouridine-5'-phosphate glycosidase